MSWIENEQRLQLAHDARNHQEIYCMNCRGRVTHYALHFGKYCGRIARNGTREENRKTLVDWFLVALSAATALEDHLSGLSLPLRPATFQDSFSSLCDATGRFCDATAQIEKLPRAREIAVAANREIIRDLLAIAHSAKIDLPELLAKRRRQLAERAFFVRDDHPAVDDRRTALTES